MTARLTVAFGCVRQPGESPLQRDAKTVLEISAGKRSLRSSHFLYPSDARADPNAAHGAHPLTISLLHPSPGASLPVRPAAAGCRRLVATGRRSRPAQDHLDVRVLVSGDPAELLHGSLLFDPVLSLHSDSLLFLGRKHSLSAHYGRGLKVATFYELPGILVRNLSSDS
jgi:hypothetical protein